MFRSTRIADVLLQYTRYVQARVSKPSLRAVSLSGYHLAAHLRVFAVGEDSNVSRSGRSSFRDAHPELSLYRRR